MFIFFECASCLIFVAIVATLLFAVSALLIVLDEGATVFGQITCGMAHSARILVARRKNIFLNFSRHTLNRKGRSLGQWQLSLQQISCMPTM